MLFFAFRHLRHRAVPTGGTVVLIGQPNLTAGVELRACVTGHALPDWHLGVVVLDSGTVLHESGVLGFPGNSVAGGSWPDTSADLGKSRHHW